MQKKTVIIKQNKGIALITLVVAILMMIVISSVIIYNSTSSFKMQNLNNMYNDIRLLNEQIFLYYSKNKELPTLNFTYTPEINEEILGDYNSEKFQIIDIDKIDKNIQSNLKFGRDYYNKNYIGKDIYIINIVTHQIFYVEGIKVDNVTYYTIPGENEYIKIDVENTFSNPPELEENLKPVIYDENLVNKIKETTIYDKNWYNYENKENLSNWARAQKENSSEIYMWVPRYSYNKTSNEIVFLKGKTNNPIQEGKDISGEKWQIPDVFTNKEKEELTGIWITQGNNYKTINNKLDLINAIYELTGKNNINGTTNTTITGGEYKYYNPIIPIGYKTISTKDASWRSTNGVYVDGWNDGLVIEDKNGNQFVWVPGNNITSSIGTTEQTQIEKYGGYYKIKNGTQILQL